MNFIVRIKKIDWISISLFWCQKRIVLSEESFFRLQMYINNCWTSFSLHSIFHLLFSCWFYLWPRPLSLIFHSSLLFLQHSLSIKSLSAISMLSNVFQRKTQFFKYFFLKKDSFERGLFKALLFRTWNDSWKNQTWHSVSPSCEPIDFEAGSLRNKMLRRW